MKLNLLKLGKLVVLGAVLTGMSAWQSASAAMIKMEVKVPGYTQRGDGWVLVLTNMRPVLVGKVHWDSVRNCYITDRVARGEVMKITISPNTPLEKCNRIALTGIAPGDWYFDKLVCLPYVISKFAVSKDPGYDNVYVNVLTTSGWYDARIPIGSR